MSAGPLFRAAALARPRTGALAGGAALAAGAVAAAIAVLALSGYLISRAAQQPPVLTLLVVIVLVRVLAMARAGLRYGERLVTHDVAFRVLADLRVSFWRRLAADTAGGPDQRGRGDLLSRFVADVDALQHLYLRGLGPPVAAALVAAVAVVATWVLLPAGALVLTGFLILGGICLPLLCAAAARHAASRQGPVRADLTAELLEVIEGSAELAAAGREADWTRRVQHADAKLRGIQRTDAHVAGLAAGAGALLAGGAAAAMAGVAVPAVESGALAGVLLAALLLLALGSFEAVAPLPDAARHLHASARAAERLEEVTDARPLVPEPLVPYPLPESPELRLEGAGVRYTDGAPWALDGVDMLLRPGLRVALVGPSGSGKSTLASLLVRLRDPDQGRVTLGGVDLRNLAVADVRRRVRLAGQDAHLFTASIAANVRLARPEAPDSEVQAALASAGLEHFVASLAEGIHTQVGRDGTQVSGGQRQRIALARLLLSDAPLLIFDEPAAHLDPGGARALLRHLAQLGSQRGILVITHTLDGLEDYDQLELVEGRLT
jgi:thiol reductant ABC exporter CydC subunit